MKRETNACMCCNCELENKVDKVWFARDPAYADSKDLAKRTVSDKNLKVNEKSRFMKVL